MRIIKDRAILEDQFAGTVVPLAALTEQTFAAGSPVGVRVPSDTLAVPFLDRLALIVVEFPKFTDGRGYSLARLLRRNGFAGELRATGYVLRDQLLYLERCGFNAFELKEGKPLESALEAFGELTHTYQATALDPRPIYRRR